MYLNIYTMLLMYILQISKNTDYQSVRKLCEYNFQEKFYLYEKSVYKILVYIWIQISEG